MLFFKKKKCHLKKKEHTHFCKPPKKAFPEKRTHLFYLKRNKLTFFQTKMAVFFKRAPLHFRNKKAQFSKNETLGKRVI